VPMAALDFIVFESYRIYRFLSIPILFLHLMSLIVSYSRVAANNIQYYWLSNSSRGGCGGRDEARMWRRCLEATVELRNAEFSPPKPHSNQYGIIGLSTRNIITMSVPTNDSSIPADSSWSDILPTPTPGPDSVRRSVES